MNRQDNCDLNQLRATLIANIEHLAEDLLGKPSDRAHREWRWGSKFSFSLVTSGPKRGLWKSFETGEGGGPLQLIQRERRCSLHDAIAWAKNWLGQDNSGRMPERREARPKPAMEPHGNTVPIAMRIWSESKPAAGTIVEGYLLSRGLRLPNDATLRFHPACPRAEEKFPAMLALMTDPVTGKPTGVHRTFIAADGSGKATGQPKMMLGGAGVIRLVSDEEVTHGLGLAEGIETALSVMQHAGWSPVWAAGNAGGIDKFPVLASIDTLTIFADHDDGGAGLSAARSCAEKWKQEGRNGTIYLPPPGMDWNDVTQGCLA